MIKLDLGQKSIFKVAGFFSEIDLLNEIKKSAHKFDTDMSAMEENVVLLQIVMGLLSNSQKEANQLFAELASVDVSAINELDVDTYMDLIEDFVQAPLLRRAFDFYKKLNS